MPPKVRLPEEQIVQHYRQGRSCRQLAADCRCTVPGILRVLRRHQVTVRRQGVRSRPQQAVRQVLDSPGLQVLAVDPQLHNSRQLAALGLPSTEARLWLRQYQLAQERPTICLWEDELQRPVWRQMVEHHNRQTADRLGARSCQVQEVPLEEARAFYDQHHLQGGCRVLELTLGLYAEGRWRAMMSFSRPQAVRGLAVPWMLQRFAVDGHLPGAASRLLHHFRADHRGQIISYSDNRYSPTGGLYQRLGFVLDKELPPDYRYWRAGRWWPKNQRQRRHLEQELGGALPGETEWQMADRAGYLRCYDCGKRRWLLLE